MIRSALQVRRAWLDGRAISVQLTEAGGERLATSDLSETVWRSAFFAALALMAAEGKHLVTRRDLAGRPFEWFFGGGDE